MARFVELARSSWTGRRAPGDLEVVDWFMGCFPIRSEETRAALRRDLMAALDEKRRLD